MPQFKCWEFYGKGDAFFGGDGDDRILHRMPDGVFKFVPSWNASGGVHALFDSREEAEAAGIAATERHGLISGIEV